MGEEVAEAGGRVDVRTERPGGHGDLRSDAAERDVVGGGHVDRNTAGHLASTDRLAPVLEEAALRANAKDTIAIEIPEDPACHTITSPDEVPEVADRLRDREVHVTVGTWDRRLAATRRVGLSGKRRSDRMESGECRERHKRARGTSRARHGDGL